MTDGRGYYTHAQQGEHEYFDLGAFVLRSGYTLPGATLAYRTHGTLNAARDNAVVFPHMYSGTPSSLDVHIGPGLPLDPERWFVICPGQLGGGMSSSPSNTAPPFDRGQFPAVSIADDVVAQHRLVTEHFGIERLHAVLGWSMGAQQTYEWAARFPAMVPRAAAFAGTARTPVHNRIFIDLHLELLRSDPAFAGGFYADSADVRLGLTRHALAFSLQGLTPEWYRGEHWRRLGFASADDFRQGFIRGYFAPMDPNNLVSQASKWWRGDLSPHGGGSLHTALGRIPAHFFVVPFGGDQFFPVEDCETDAGHLPHGELRVIDTPAGHFAMFGLLDEDTRLIHEVMAEMLDSPG
ncbi:alpha/beta fold hydrolase [Actinomycetospora flava]|uniref:Alpha/beta fold hydrolase n=1 Tax=Actinomycetospora flava TaxID=3129232 RepID=A0ABU8LZW1_9PSEU